MKMLSLVSLGCRKGCGMPLELYKDSQDERGVLRIHLNRPEVHNAFNDELIKQLTDRLKKVEADSSLRLVVLTGEGKSFCAGADLHWMKKMKEYSDEENYRDSLALSQLFESFNNCPVPILARCHGAALGGGTGLLAVCDFVMAAEEATFGFTEVTLGLIPAVISPYVVAKIGETQARAYFLSGMRFEASRAQTMGLVHEVVALNQLDKQFEKVVERFLRAAPLATRAAKQLVREVMKWRNPNPSEDLRDSTCRMIAQLRVEKEGQEGMSALLEKRRPAWGSVEGKKSESI